MPSRTYWLSVCSSTRHGRFSASSAWIAAISSMRLLVVAGSPPADLLARGRRRPGPRPSRPGPGLPAAGAVGVDRRPRARRSCPVTRGRSRARRDAAGGSAACATYSSGSLRLDQRAGRRRQPVVQAGQEEAQRRAAGQHRQGRPLGRRTAAAALGSRATRARALVTLNDPSGSKHQAFRQTRDVVGEAVVAGEVEVDERRDSRSLEEEHVVGEEVGVDHAGRQALRPVRLEQVAARSRSVARQARPQRSSARPRQRSNSGRQPAGRGRWRGGRAKAAAARCSCAKRRARRPRSAPAVGRRTETPGEEGDERRRAARRAGRRVAAVAVGAPAAGRDSRARPAAPSGRGRRAGPPASTRFS